MPEYHITIWGVCVRLTTGAEEDHFFPEGQFSRLLPLWAPWHHANAQCLQADIPSGQGYIKGNF